MWAIQAITGAWCETVAGMRRHDDAIFILRGVVQADVQQFADQKPAQIKLPGRTG